MGVAPVGSANRPARKTPFIAVAFKGGVSDLSLIAA
jgi:hypothetical protein